MVIDYKSIIVNSTSAWINFFYFFLVQAKLRLSRMRRSHSAARHVAGFGKPLLYIFNPPHIKETERGENCILDKENASNSFSKSDISP